MPAKDVVRRYFDALAQKTGWQAFLADSFAFRSFVSPPKQVAGKAAYLEATQRFFSMISAVEVRDLIVDGAKVCALTRYQLRSPGGMFHSDVAEIFTVRDGEIDSLSIYFDSSPFPK